MGRGDAQVKLRGYRIELGEIEQVLAAHPAVSQAAVIMELGETGEQRLAAYIEPRKGAEEKSSRLELWPSVAEFFVFDDILYTAMGNDERRIDSYRRALRRVVQQKVVLDIGTGNDAILSRLCIEEGALRVYAVEVLEETYRRARARVAHLGLGEQIIVLHGDATTITLPESIDVCVSGIVGSIGGSEGAAQILNATHRLLKPQAAILPQRSLTRIAAVSLPAQFLAQPGWSPLSVHYVQQIFEQVGYPFDVRLWIKNVTPADLMSDAGTFEDLDFTDVIAPESEHSSTLAVRRSGVVDGFLVWLHLYIGEGEELDILEHQHSWLPVYLPVFYPGIEVSADDCIEVTCQRTLALNQRNPNYRVEGRLIRQSGEIIPFYYEMPHVEQRFQATPFYKALFPTDTPYGHVRDLALETLASADLMQYMQRSLPSYMLPTTIVLLDHLPLTISGKIDRRALARKRESLVGTEEAQSEATDAPRTPIEEMLLIIWRELLGNTSLGINDDFFDAGGHSLLATRLVSRLQALFQVTISVTDLFETATIAAFAPVVEQALRGDAASAMPLLVPAPRMGELPLSFAQQRIWFLDQLEPGNVIYLIPVAQRLSGSLVLAALERSIVAVVQRHETLRTTFSQSDGRAVQVIHAVGRSSLSLIDLRGLAPEMREAEARSLAEQEASQACDLGQGPLLRTYLLRLAAEDHVFLLTLHHIIADGQSGEIVMRELTAFYQAESSGQTCALSPLAVQYADFAVWQRGWLQGKILEQQLAYWKVQLADAPPLHLPIDHPRSPVQTYRGASYYMTLPPALRDSLQALSKRENVTLFMTLLAAFQVLLARYSGQTDISIGTPIANRNHEALAGLIGLFVNTLVMRTNLAENPSFVDLLARVRVTALGAYAHQDVPFEQLVEELRPARDLSRSPLFQIMFSMQQASGSGEHVEGLQLRRLDVAHHTTKFDLTLSTLSTTQGLQCGIEYNSDLFEEQTVHRLFAHWRVLLEAIIALPEQPIF
ncbi:MAG TPA: condensation domain-containing protein, partial [Ktedonobacteraceae bacterium]|nr:condensation domain-containing protein [Ktedonobacteraceae bacterium]